MRSDRSCRPQFRPFRLSRRRYRSAGSVTPPESRREVRKRVRRVPLVKADFSFYRCRDCQFLFVEPRARETKLIFLFTMTPITPGVARTRWLITRRNITITAPPFDRFEFEDLVPLRAGALETATRSTGIDLPARWGVAGELARLWLRRRVDCKYLRDVGGLVCGGVSLPLHPAGHDVGSYSERLKNDDGFEILGWDELDRTCQGRFDIISCIEVIEHIPQSPRCDRVARSLPEAWRSLDADHSQSRLPSRTVAGNRFRLLRS